MNVLHIRKRSHGMWECADSFDNKTDLQVSMREIACLQFLVMRIFVCLIAVFHMMQLFVLANVEIVYRNCLHEIYIYQVGVIKSHPYISVDIFK